MPLSKVYGVPIERAFFPIGFYISDICGGCRIGHGRVVCRVLLSEGGRFV